jgi:large conductance mechanosensitive channel
MLQGFKQFILKGNVVDLAVGIVIGSTFSAVVSAFTKDVLNPFISLIFGQPNFSYISFTINRTVFTVGDFLNTFVAFLITASVIYFFVVLPMNKFVEITQLTPTTRAISTKKCPFCFSEISVKATRCAFCTSELDEHSKKK